METRACSRSITKRLARLADVLELGRDERLLSACEAFAADAPQPSAVFEVFGIVGVGLGQTLGGLAAQRRLDKVRSCVGELDLAELPEAGGYLIALTTERLMVVDSSTAKPLRDVALDGLSLGAYDHGKGMQTLIFDTGSAELVLTTRRDGEWPRLTEHFLTTFAQYEPALAA